MQIKKPSLLYCYRFDFSRFTYCGGGEDSLFLLVSVWIHIWILIPDYLYEKKLENRYTFNFTDQICTYLSLLFFQSFSVKEEIEL